MANFQKALESFRLGELRQAEQLCREIIAGSQDNVDALHLLGIIQCQKGNPSAGVALIGKAARLDPQNAIVHSSLGNAQAELHRHHQAIESYDRALAIDPGLAQAHFNRGNVLAGIEQFEKALASYDRAIECVADFPQALFNRANVLETLNRPLEALADFDRVAALAPEYAPAHVNRGAVLQTLNRHQDALAAYDRALVLEPGDVDALNNRGDVLAQLKRNEEALVCFDRALARNPDYLPALHNRGTALRDLKRYDDAAGAYAKLLALQPDHSFLPGELLHVRMLACDWTQLGRLSDTIENDLHAGKKAADPYGYQAISNSEHDLKRCAEIYAAEKFPPRPPLWSGEKYGNARIRVGYLSGEFRQQATAILMAELFERHDKDRFELFAFDNGWDDDSEIRQRINNAFDEIVGIANLGDAEAAAEVKNRRIDILVNLNGYFGQLRQGVFSYRPAPVQVNYLGFPGTLGASYIDYIIADKIVIPPDSRDCYTEQVVYLPDSYQVNDSKRRIAESTPSRREANLPEQGFVFCCFNNNYKIIPDVFAVWMRLLKKVGGSVLWLLDDNPAATRNLQKEAASRGVDSARLIFAPRTLPDAHLARHRLADLFLDTLPYNAHTTASDALWAGLPLVTCAGTTFPGRVAASLLTAVGMEELVTTSLEDYAALAGKLATSPALLEATRAKLNRNLRTHPLFDCGRFTRHIESAYTTMWQRCQHNEPPQGFAVAPE